MAPESIADWVRFRHCRDSDMTLTPAQKDNLMHFLLNERRNVVELFEKATFLVSRREREKGQSPTIKRLTDEELLAHHIDQDNAHKTKEQQQAAAAAQMKAILDADKATEQHQQADWSHSRPVAQTTRHDVSVLLACLHRLALEEHEVESK